ncbi:TIGR04282 family arsenosugar biosynthesis glycosyltransferase [Aquimarina sp. ERC-38]|uniref:TIGR04282 family arsenosugar biosynthesis glycosyltransferase n=1 Tax=Aquimarina sp. ERC-38 TaxID=2949996 RepID=UPI0022454A68|nr:TIGR04282 family arsenosugar biosynthesis glycosyltransferase [Aquimarina sp. ERC-38]UZO81478.1 TIGR04282 family arsenosugar biosynthesis glycosyltransferase [Aquimarina sp. ERC-38]
MQSSEAIIVFTRNPELGKVKTRLAKEVGDTAALEIYQFLLQHTYEIVRKSNADKLIWYSNEIIENDIWKGEHFYKHQQQGEDLGERMHFAFQTAFQLGYTKVCIIGSDLFDLQVAHIQEAFSHLDTNNAVIGPAEDGGYYLLGLTELIPSLFKDKKWGTSSVYEQSVQNLKETSYTKLTMLNDIDYKKDVLRYPELIEIIEKYKNNL